MRPRVVLERATIHDLAALAELEARCFSHPWSEAQFGAELALAPPSTVLVLRAAPGGGAAAELCAACAYRVFQDEMEVLDLAVDPRWRRRGLARRLLAFALRRGARAGARSARLEVRAGNNAALALYGAFGFRRVGLRRAYYTQPVEDAVLLVKEALADGE